MKGLPLQIKFPQQNKEPHIYEKNYINFKFVVQ